MLMSKFKYKTWSNKYCRAPAFYKYRENREYHNRRKTVITSQGAFEVIDSSFASDSIDGGWGTVYHCRVLTETYTKSTTYRPIFEIDEIFYVGEPELWCLCELEDDFLAVTEEFRKHIPIIRED